MNNSTLAKIFGWLQFGTQTLGQIASSPTSVPHGWAGWLTIFSSLAAAVGIHAAGSTDGQK